MKIALAQVNPTVGDLVANRKLVQESVARAVDAKADLVLLPELVLCGYPPMDLLRRDGFVRDQLRELDALLPASREVAIALGAVVPWPSGRPNTLANAAVLLAGGERVAVRPKSLLPNYDVFDERRYFAQAEERSPVRFPGRDELLGLTVCEDTWVDDVAYDINPVQELAAAGAHCILNPSASPWHVDKPKRRRELLAGLASANGVPIAFVNQFGGNDELIFDGGSFVVDARGRIITSLPLFESGFSVVDIPGSVPGLLPAEVEDPSAFAQLEAGLAIGIRDYFLKQSLPPGAVIGLSGGIDSAVTAHLAVEALGAERVVGVAMPGPFSSGHSVDDALALGRNLGIDVRKVDITPIYESYREVFGDLFGVRDDYGLTQQNIQSRIRGAILMAVSNDEQRLVLATGNKSELSLGYCTLYGDTVGGLAVLGDVYKRDVYALARYANERAGCERIPSNTIDKPPSAELAPDQKDENDLPPYDFIDRVLEQVIEGERGAAGVEPPEGGSREMALGVVARLDRNEYKRRQTPLVLRTSPKAFGSGRRLPIVHRYKD